MLKEKWDKRRNVIADGWKKLVAKPGTGQRTGKENIIDKAWIGPDGELIHHGPATTHQEWAIKFLRDTKDPAAKTIEGRTLTKVDNIMLKRGYIRVQIYDTAGMGLQGSEDAIRARGYVALQLLPKPRRVYVMLWPENETSMYAADELGAIGLA